MFRHQKTYSVPSLSAPLTGEHECSPSRNPQVRLSSCGICRNPTFRESLPAQPVDATPSAINLFSKGGVYDSSETSEAFRDAEDRHVEPLEGGTAQHRTWQHQWRHRRGIYANPELGMGLAIHKH